MDGYFHSGKKTNFNQTQKMFYDSNKPERGNKDMKAIVPRTKGGCGSEMKQGAKGRKPPGVSNTFRSTITLS